MTLDPKKLRLDGIYQQRGDDRYMQRIKVPAGALATEQAFKVADLADRFAGGRVHLTTRGSIELHDVAGADLAPVQRELARVGLTGRGACGGAVRGVACSSTLGPNYEVCQTLARKLHRHFAGNPYFEGLAKKFKIGVDGDYGSSRHLIQDVGLVLAAEDSERRCWDVWCAGGLGREPQAAFLLANRVPEDRLLPLIEGVLRVYHAQAPPGRRLKYVVAEIGETAFRDLLRVETGEPPVPQVDNGLGQIVAPVAAGAGDPVLARIFAGELTTTALRLLAAAAAAHAGGALALTADQDIVFFPESPQSREDLGQALAAAGFDGAAAEQQVAFRICPGSHECRLGLAPTRDLARELIAALSPAARTRSWAISGCPNACAQPYLAEVGIVASGLGPTVEGERHPRFTLLRRSGEGFGTPVATDLARPQLVAAAAALDR
jgi:sulfite reductase beta subunit-like hemoprotein